MKMPIGWHEDCCRCLSASVLAQENLVKRETEELARKRSRLDFYLEQISTAINEGLDSFDQDKYLIKRKKP